MSATHVLQVMDTRGAQPPRRHALEHELRSVMIWALECCRTALRFRMQSRPNRAFSSVTEVMRSRNFCLDPKFNLIEDNEESSAERRATGGKMFRFVASMFGCAHTRCTFPITAKHPNQSDGTTSVSTYVVCLDCGREFPYDWQQMKIIHSTEQVA